MTDLAADGPELVIERDLMVPMRDGVRLRTDVFRPAGPGPFPTLVTRYPYVADEMTDAGAMLVARQGYAVVWQHCRGRYGSEGVFYPFRDDGPDGYDTVEWAAAQPWSNGRVASYGASYGGMQAWATAVLRPPHLVAIAPVSSAPSYFGCNIMYWAQGVMGLGFGLMWTGQITTWEAVRAGVPQPLPEFEQLERAMKEMASDPDAFLKAAMDQTALMSTLLTRRPLREIAELAELAPWWRDWCDNDDPRDAFWRRQNALDRIDDLTVPIFHMTGWYDLFTGATLDGFAALKRYGADPRVSDAHRLVVGPWSHVPGVPPRPDLPVGPEQTDMYDHSPGSPLMQFLGHHLKGENPDYGERPPVRVFVMGANRWREDSQWPPAEARATSYWLRSGGGANTLDGDGSLSLEPPAGEPADSFVYDPADPVPGPIGVGLGGGPEIEPSATGRRADVLVYTSEPLEEDLEVVGPVAVKLWASSSVADTDFTAKLIDVFPDGTAQALCQGVVRTRYATAAPVTPGAVHQFDVSVGATANVFRAGHRIRLHVSSSEFPTYELNPNTGERLTHDPSGRTITATQHVFHDAQHPSNLVLPVIPH
ncbi:CocE/NonD family hydrolase [Pseudofrankia inefficax]|uniref:Hydrolase CocE/NonD family protein n=1 Tax=Pseudofrankia inefficax (strain DSM 45817 / CECT 9037 / DDB 130130 / EuI1c) TaxID=298654 RepID=E3J9P3_PSEI1|nr:CocE/NonD family hydrolase [Pseudofrankia inefficax]ADP84546.1 hydrolase CocE/NonD family protein [Pseudofrankia inefficax]